MTSGIIFRDMDVYDFNELEMSVIFLFSLDIFSFTSHFVIYLIPPISSLRIENRTYHFLVHHLVGRLHGMAWRKENKKTTPAANAARGVLFELFTLHGFVRSLT